MPYASYEELHEEVGEHNGLLKVQMAELRDLEKAGRLGAHVRNRISVNLTLANLGHFPTELPNDQGDWVRIYRQDMPIGSMLDAVFHPSERGDKLLRGLSDRDAEAEKKLNEVRLALEDAIALIDS